ncbi:MAG: 30S ribosomal protein S20 [Firmicutes bacterium]|nr:30S ribosomal protein S20 [Bacillota bacterium]
MANIKSAKKRVKVIAKKTLLNKMVKSSTKTAMKKVVVAVEAGNKEAAQVALKGAISAIDGAYAKGIFHKNAAARKKSSLTKMVNNIQ